MHPLFEKAGGLTRSRGRLRHAVERGQCQDAPKSDQVTDFYLASLAEKHGMKLATLDEHIKHPAVVLVK